MSASKPAEELIALGERLLTLRKRTGLHQYEVAEVLKFRTATLGDWEAGRSEPRLFQAVALADLYIVSVDVLIGRAPMPPIIKRKWSADE